MKLAQIREKAALGVLALYGLYGVFMIPFTYFLLSIAVGLIVFSTVESTEVAVIVTLLTGVIATLIGQAKRKEPFVDGGAKISQRIAAMSSAGPAASVLGMQGPKPIEGFEDAKPTVSAPAAADEKKEDGLFKLGSIPTEGKGGFHIDQGTTVLNALNALQPDQVKKMSEDTQKLIDTQKSLMMMLGTMKPMLSDGKQLIDTFNQMFGPNAMAQIGASGSEALALASPGPRQQAQAAPPTADSLAANAGKTTTSK
jgi:hypothetical protein